MSNTPLNADDELFNPVLHARLWEIVKRFHDHPDGSYESQAVEDLTKLYHADRKKRELQARIDEWKAMGDFLTKADKEALSREFLDLYRLHGERLKAEREAL